MSQRFHGVAELHRMSLKQSIHTDSPVVMVRHPLPKPLSTRPDSEGRESTNDNGVFFPSNSKISVTKNRRGLDKTETGYPRIRGVWVSRCRSLSTTCSSTMRSSTESMPRSAQAASQGHLTVPIPSHNRPASPRKPHSQHPAGCFDRHFRLHSTGLFLHHSPYKAGPRP